MNYYKRHLGDYAKNTRTLSTYEHGVYNLVLDLYYTDEEPVSTEDAYAICRADSAKDRAMVDRVLAKFFTQEGDMWRHERADEEIAKYREKSEKNKAIGSLGGKQKAKRNASETLSDQVANGLANDNPSHKPLANRKEKAPPTPSGGLQTFTAWIDSLPTGELPVPAGHHVFAYAERVGLPSPYLELAWIAFEKRYRGVAKRYKAWRDVFRKAVEGNWAKLWWIDTAGEYKLTTVGLQLQREIREAA